jgi:TRAP-type C4-dicarboxylate transport system permease small subunit
MTFLDRLPRIAVTVLLTLAILNLLIGVFLRYIMPDIADYMNWEQVPFTWVEEVGEMSLAWLTLIGAAIGVRSRAHFTLQVLVHKLPDGLRRAIDVMNHLLIAGFGLLAAWYAVKLCQLNWTLRTAGLELSLALLYASAVIGGLLIAVYAISMMIAPPPRDPNALH